MTDLSKDLHTRHMVLNMGPSHPAMHGVFRILATLDGENIIDTECEIGYLHRAFEKMCETVTYNQCVPYTDRLNYVSPLMNNVGFALAAEKLFDMDVPPRCKVIRVLCCEISRIVDHLICIAANAMELGAFTVFLYFVEAREYLWDLIEELTGARMTTSYTRVGGLAHDLPDGFVEHTREALTKVEKLIADGAGLITRNRIFIDRMKNVGVISQEDAIQYGYTGPCLRATGVYYDIRKAQPYLGYEDYDFEVPLGTRGDSYGRFLVRLEEMFESIRIVKQALDNLPAGPVNVDDPRISLPSKEHVYNDIEGLMNHFKLIYEGVRPPAGEVYSATEAANGELGYYIVSDGTGRPYRMRLRGPCYAIFQAMPLLIKGAMIADVVATFGSINIIAGEIDR